MTETRTIASDSAIDRIFGVPVTTRNWNTVMKLQEMLDDDA